MGEKAESVLIGDLLGAVLPSPMITVVYFTFTQCVKWFTHILDIGILSRNSASELNIKPLNMEYFSISEPINSLRSVGGISGHHKNFKSIQIHPQDLFGPITQRKIPKIPEDVRISRKTHTALFNKISPKNHLRSIVVYCNAKVNIIWSPISEASSSFRSAPSQQKQFFITISQIIIIFCQNW